MQQLKFKIKETESASVEIVPCADGGVEIIINYGSETQKNYGSSNNKPFKSTATSQPFKFHNNQDMSSQGKEKSNAEIIKDFCSEKKTEEGVDLKQLKSFFDFYTAKSGEWKGQMDADKLWNRWMETAK